MDSEKKMFTPLQRACFRRRTEEVRRHLAHGNVDLEARTTNGNTILILSVLGGSVECVRLLLEAGAQVHAKNDFGLDALDYAHHARNLEIITAIAEYDDMEQ